MDDVLRSCARTSIVNVSEGGVDEVAQVASLLCYVRQQGDGVVLATVQVEQGFGQTCFAGGRFWNGIKRNISEYN